MRPPARTRRWPTRAAAGALAACALATAALWLAPEDSLAGAPLRYGPRWVAAAPPAGLAVACVALRSGRAVGLAVVALGPFAGLRVSPLAATVEQESGRLRVVTLNCDGDAADGVRVAALVSQWQPDLIFLQDPDRVGRPGGLPAGWATTAGPGGSALASRAPARAAGGGRGADGFAVASPFWGLTAVNVHLPTPRDGLEAVLRREPGAGGRVAEQARDRSAASRAAREFAGPPRANLFVAGDFNVPVESPAFRRDSGGFGNAFGSAGTGFGWTLFTRRAAVRVDQILFGPGWECHHAWVGPDVGSAHRPLLADFAPAVGR